MYCCWSVIDITLPFMKKDDAPAAVDVVFASCAGPRPPFGFLPFRRADCGSDSSDDCSLVASSSSAPVSDFPTPLSSEEEEDEVEDEPANRGNEEDASMAADGDDDVDEDAEEDAEPEAEPEPEPAVDDEPAMAVASLDWNMVSDARLTPSASSDRSSLVPISGDPSPSPWMARRK